jgi:O-antigen/teichoic acid export membrane protein
MWVLPCGFVAACFLAAGVAHFVSLSASAALFAVAAIALFALTAWRPAIGCAVLALSVPMTAGLGRDTVLPVLRISEAVTIVVVLGALLHHLPRRAAGRFTGLDLAIGAYAAGVVLIPCLVLFTSRTPAGIDTWRYVLGPVQYVLVYWLFSRTELRDLGWRTVINLTMAASVVAAVAGLAQLADVPGVRAFLAGTYPLGGGGEPLCPYGICRPMSFLEHAPAFGGYALLNYVLALALASRRRLAFPTWWLATVMALNAAAVLASQTQAAIICLVVATGLIIWHARTVPRQLLPTAAALVIGVIVFLPQVSARIDQQFGGGTGTPQSLSTRYQYWGEYFLPDLADHFLVGTGTVLPADIPVQFETYVDNEYLRLGFRAGLLGVVLLLTMYPTVALVGWWSRRAADPRTAAIGAAAVAYVAVMAIMGTTAEYLTFTGVSQQFWMLVGLLGAMSLTPRSKQQPSVVLGTFGIAHHPFFQTGSTARLIAIGQALLPEGGLVRSSAVVFAGNTAARLIGFLFSLASARLLLPSGYGAFAFALTVATLGSMLLTVTPIGLSRTLPRLSGRREREVVFSNTVAAVSGVLGISLALTTVGAWAVGIKGTMLAAVLATVVATALYVTYRETQRAMERYVPFGAVFFAANLLELAGVLIAAATGHRSAPLFLTLYGLSYLAALLILFPLAPLGLRFRPAFVTVPRTIEVLRFASPLFLQTVALTVWLGGDLLIVSKLLSAASAGQYAAAKTVATVFYLASAAVAGPLMPRASRLASHDLRPYLLRVLGLVSLLTAPVLILLVLLRRPLFELLFGTRYGQAAEPFTLLAIATSLYGLYLVFEHIWLARGRPGIDALATGTGAVVSLGLLFVLVPHLRLVGAALAFLVGAVVQVVTIGVITARALGREPLTSSPTPIETTPTGPLG